MSEMNSTFHIVTINLATQQHRLYVPMGPFLLQNTLIPDIQLIKMKVYDYTRRRSCVKI